MKIGKLSEADLAGLLCLNGAADPDVLLGPAYGEDAGAVNIGGQVLVASTDPITFATEEIGWYSVHINANDIAVSGGTPRWYLPTVLLPEHAYAEWIEDIFKQMNEACKSLGVAIISGHTEVTPGLKRPIICGTMLGIAGAGGPVKTGGAKVGDAIILTKGVCIEGTAMLALERPVEARYILGEEYWERACEFLRNPGISVVRDAQIAREHKGVHAMHDPTEGGLYMGLYELASASGLGVKLNEDHVLVYEEANELCLRFGLDPMRMLASGALLVCVEPAEADALVARCKRSGIWAGVIGEMVAEGMHVYRRGLEYPLLYENTNDLSRMAELDLL